MLGNLNDAVNLELHLQTPMNLPRSRKLVGENFLNFYGHTPLSAARYFGINNSTTTIEYASVREGLLA